MKKKIILILFLSLLLTSASFAQEAVDYKLLAPLPISGETAAESSTPSTYIEGVVKLVIGLSGILAVVMIMFGGIKYMSTDAFTGKSDAKNTIQNALWGLAMVLGAWMILFTISPDLVKFDISLTRFIPPERASSTPIVLPPVIVPPPGNGGLLPTPTRAWRLVPESAPKPGGKCIDDRSGRAGTQYTKDGEPFPKCPSDTPTMVDLKVVLPEAGARCVDAGPCKIHANGLPGMRRFVEYAKIHGLEWKIIDAYPPSNDHINICHQNGGCVDIQSVPINVAGFVKLCRVARSSNLDYLNESGVAWQEDPSILSACIYRNILRGDSPSHLYAQLHVFF
jgi:hypothetical protein